MHTGKLTNMISSFGQPEPWRAVALILMIPIVLGSDILKLSRSALEELRENLPGNIEKVKKLLPLEPDTFILTQKMVGTHENNSALYLLFERYLEALGVGSLGDETIKALIKPKLIEGGWILEDVWNRNQRHWSQLMTFEDPEGDLEEYRREYEVTSILENWIAHPEFGQENDKPKLEKCSDSSHREKDQIFESKLWHKKLTKWTKILAQKRSDDDLRHLSLDQLEADLQSRIQQLLSETCDLQYSVKQPPPSEEGHPPYTLGDAESINLPDPTIEELELREEIRRQRNIGPHLLSKTAQDVSEMIAFVDKLDPRDEWTKITSSKKWAQTIVKAETDICWQTVKKHNLSAPIKLETLNMNSSFDANFLQENDNSVHKSLRDKLFKKSRCGCAKARLLQIDVLIRETKLVIRKLSALMNFKRHTVKKKQKRLIKGFTDLPNHPRYGQGR